MAVIVPMRRPRRVAWRGARAASAAGRSDRRGAGISSGSTAGGRKAEREKCIAAGFERAGFHLGKQAWPWRQHVPS